MKYLTNTFTPMMLSQGTKAIISECELNEIPPISSLTSAISHEITAKILSALLEAPVVFNRINLQLKSDDEVYAVIPNFRADCAREFTKEEVESAGFRCFRITIL